MSITKETRRESYRMVQTDAKTRRRIVFEILSGGGGIIAREVAAGLRRRGITPTDERNFAAPRVTELKDSEKIETVGKKVCYRTGRNVATWAVKNGDSSG